MNLSDWVPRATATPMGNRLNKYGLVIKELQDEDNFKQKSHG